MNKADKILEEKQGEFPSPTGVNYYESMNALKASNKAINKGFRPQQGLTIMNYISEMRTLVVHQVVSVPNRG